MKLVIIYGIILHELLFNLCKFRYSFRYNLPIKLGGARWYQNEKTPKFKENKKQNGAKKSKSFSHVAVVKNISNVVVNNARKPSIYKGL